MEPSILKTYIFQKGFITEGAKLRREQEAQGSTLQVGFCQYAVPAIVSKPGSPMKHLCTVQVTGAVGWRKDGIKYKKNEVYLDIIEEVNLMMSSKGQVLRSDVNGKVVMKIFLSGMPDVKLGLNEKLDVSSIPPVLLCIALQNSPGFAAGTSLLRPSHTGILQDVSFHQCVNLGRYNTEKVVSFVPPDGEFELMRYRCNDNISLPFRVLPVINELGRTRLEVKVAVKSAFNDKLFALNVVITVPMPNNTARADVQPSQGMRLATSATPAGTWLMRQSHLCMQAKPSMMQRNMLWSGKSSALMGSGSIHCLQQLNALQRLRRKKCGHDLQSA